MPRVYCLCGHGVCVTLTVHGHRVGEVFNYVNVTLTM